MKETQYWAWLTREKQDIFNDLHTGGALRNEALENPNFWRPRRELLPPKYKDLVRDVQSLIQMGHRITPKESEKAEPEGKGGEDMAQPETPMLYKGAPVKVWEEKDSTQASNTPKRLVQYGEQPAVELKMSHIYELLIEWFNVASTSPNTRDNLKFLSDLTRDAEAKNDGTEKKQATRRVGSSTRVRSTGQVGSSSRAASTSRAASSILPVPTNTRATSGRNTAPAQVGGDDDSFVPDDDSFDIDSNSGAKIRNAEVEGLVSGLKGVTLISKRGQGRS